MALIPCPACAHRVSEQAIACPACGHPIATPSGAPQGIVRTLGGVAGTYISANAVVQLVLGAILFICAAAVLITLILRG